MKKGSLVCLMALAASMFAAQAQATSIKLDLGYTFSGAVPNSSAPYATVLFNDGVDCGGGGCAVNTVQMILTASLGDTSEFITEWDFNSKVALGPTAIAYQSGTGTFGYAIGQYVANNYRADGDGLYDFQILFDSAGPSRFNGTDSAVFLITGTGITAGDFDTLSQPAGGWGPFRTAAHVQGITPGCSGWIADGTGAGPGSYNCTAVPDSGTTAALLGLALLGVGYIRRKIA